MNRIDTLLTLIGELWKEHPDFRFFQLLRFIGLDTSCDHFYLEDNILINMFSNKVYNLPIMREQMCLIEDIEEKLGKEFSGKVRGEATKFIRDNMDEYMLRSGF